MDEARLHHYLFAHQYLLKEVFERGELLLPALVGEEGPALLRSIWEVVGNSLDESERLEPEGLDCCSRIMEGNRLIIVVVMPAVEGLAEAWFVGIVGPLPDQPALPRMFTLEQGQDIFNDDVRTVMCEWTEDGRHRNFGTGSDVNVDDFVGAIEKIISP